MIGLNGGLLGAQRSTNTSTAPGAWTANEQALLKRASAWPLSGDPYFGYNSLLLHMDGSNGSTTFTDSSSNALTVTANGNAQISTAQSKFGGASAAFDGNGDWLSSSTNSALVFGTGDFTVEFFARWNSFSSYNSLYDSRSGGGSAAGFIILTSSAGVLSVYSGTTFVVSSTALSANSWYHVACTRSGSNLRLFIDGSLAGSATYANNLTDGNLIVGKTNEALSNYFNGYMDDLRITKGVARYTAAFTPPTTAFPNA